MIRLYFLSRHIDLMSSIRPLALEIFMPECLRRFVVLKKSFNEVLVRGVDATGLNGGMLVIGKPQDLRAWRFETRFLLHVWHFLAREEGDGPYKIPLPRALRGQLCPSFKPLSHQEVGVHEFRKPTTPDGMTCMLKSLIVQHGLLFWPVPNRHGQSVPITWCSGGSCGRLCFLLFFFSPLCDFQKHSFLQTISTQDLGFEN
jgi:hypothetical protein